MADNNGLVKIGLFAGAAYLAYRQGWLSFLGVGTPAVAATTTGTSTTGTTATTPPAAATPPAPPKYPPLSAIRSLTLILANADQAAKVATCGDQPPQNLPGLAPGMVLPNPAYFTWLNCRGNVQPMMPPDDWNVYLVRAGGPNPAPDPLAAFPGVDRSQPMSFDTYWSGMVKVFAAQGMAGLAAFYRRRVA